MQIEKFVKTRLTNTNMFENIFTNIVYIGTIIHYL